MQQRYCFFSFSKTNSTKNRYLSRGHVAAIHADFPLCGMKVTDFLLLSCQSHLAEDLTQQLFIMLFQAFFRTLETTKLLKVFKKACYLKKLI